MISLSSKANLTEFEIKETFNLMQYVFYYWITENIVHNNFRMKGLEKLKEAVELINQSIDRRKENET